jgi:hypothetical protein
MLIVSLQRKLKVSRFSEEFCFCYKICVMCKVKKLGNRSRKRCDHCSFRESTIEENHVFEEDRFGTHNFYLSSPLGLFQPNSIEPFDL